MIKNVHFLYFSPTGKSRQAGEAVAAALAKTLGASLRPFDITLPKAREWQLAFGPEDLLLLAMPTYAGRLPNKIAPYVKEQILVDVEAMSEEKGASAGKVPALALVTYGKRAYENSLGEMAGLLEDNGFALVGGAAVCAAHAMVPAVAKGMPDEESLARLADFGEKIGKRLLAAKAAGEPLPEAQSIPGERHPAHYYRPVDLAGEPTDFLKALPRLREDLCTACGLCENCCPMDSIHMEQPAGPFADTAPASFSKMPRGPFADTAPASFSKTPRGPFADTAPASSSPATQAPFAVPAASKARPRVEGICIKCHSCVRRCPEGAWRFEDEALDRHLRMLRERYAGPGKAPELFL